MTLRQSGLVGVRGRICQTLDSGTCHGYIVAVVELLQGWWTIPDETVPPFFKEFHPLLRLGDTTYPYLTNYARTIYGEKRWLPNPSNFTWFQSVKGEYAVWYRCGGIWIPRIFGKRFGDGGSDGMFPKMAMWDSKSITFLDGLLLLKLKNDKDKGDFPLQADWYVLVELRGLWDVRIAGLIAKEEVPHRWLENKINLGHCDNRGVPQHRLESLDDPETGQKLRDELGIVPEDRSHLTLRKDEVLAIQRRRFRKSG